MRPAAWLALWLAMAATPAAAGWSEPWPAVVLFQKDGRPVLETATGAAIPVALEGIGLPPLLPLFAVHAAASNPDPLEPSVLLDSEMLRLAVERFAPGGSRVLCRENGNLDFGRHMVVCADSLGRDIGALLVASGVVWACASQAAELPPDLDYAAVAAASPYRPLGAPPEGCDPY